MGPGPQAGQGGGPWESGLAPRVPGVVPSGHLLHGRCLESHLKETASHAEAVGREGFIYETLGEERPSSRAREVNPQHPPSGKLCSCQHDHGGQRVPWKEA